MLTCNNGYCRETAQVPTCIYDEGFVGTYCNQQSSDYSHRIQLMPAIADLNVLSINDDLFILMGTANDRVLPIFQPSDLIYFQLNNTYDPSASDPVNDYYFVWTLNLVKNGNAFD